MQKLDFEHIYAKYGEKKIIKVSFLFAHSVIELLTIGKFGDKIAHKAI